MHTNANAHIRGTRAHALEDTTLTGAIGNVQLERFTNIYMFTCSAPNGSFEITKKKKQQQNSKKNIKYITSV